MSDRVVTASELARSTSALLDEVDGGATVIIERRGRPVARLVPTTLEGSAVLGRMAGRATQVVDDDELLSPVPDWRAR